MKKMFKSGLNKKRIYMLRNVGIILVGGVKNIINMRTKEGKEGEIQMKRKLASTVLVAMLVSAVLLLFVGNAAADMESSTKAAPEEWNNRADNRVSSNVSLSSTTIYVPDNYTKIQWAVDNATAGDTIIVRDGAYVENVDVNKRLTIRSENGTDVTVVQAVDPDDHVFKVTADYVEINGFKVMGVVNYGGYEAGIYVVNADEVEIIGNVISETNNGIHLHSSYNSIINNNTYGSDISSHIIRYTGIYLDSSLNITIINNNISRTNSGIYLFSSSDNTLTNNKVSDNAGGILITSSSSNNCISNNNASENHWYGVYIESSSDNTIRNNIVNSNNWGGYYSSNIQLYSANNNIIDNNTVHLNDCASIWLRYSINNTIMKNNISKNILRGIHIDWSSDNTIYLNNFIENGINAYSLGDSLNIWNSTEKITYVYNGTTYANYLGNYWDDYTDIDADNDGIWDHPYPIDSDRDYHPLVEPFENYEEKWSFAIITDLHIGRGYPDYGGAGYDDGNTGQDYYLTERLKKAVEWINENKSEYNIKFVIVLGDISDSGEYSELNKSKNILDKLDVPYVPVIGNHDVLPYTEYEEYDVPFFGGYPPGRERFEEIFEDAFENCSKFFENWSKQLIDEPGNPPHLQNYAFSYQGMHFIFLDCVASEPFFGPPKGVGSDAVLYDETKNWLRERLNDRSGGKVILISHHPLNKSLTKAFSNDELKDVCEIIEESGCEVVNFAGHIHGSGITRGGDWGHLWHNYFMDANKEYVHKDDKTGLLLHSITTEALMVGQNSAEEDGVKGIIRMVNVSGKDISYEPERANDEFLSINPFLYLNSEKEMGVGRQINFTFYPFYSWRWKTLRYTVDWKDSTPIETHTVSTSIITGEIRERINHTYNKAGSYIINVTITDLDNPGHVEWITRNITAVEEVKEPYKVINPLFLLATLWNGADVTENPQNTPEWVLLTKITSEPKPIGEVFIHFEKATEDIDLSNLTADVNLTARKSMIYMPSWPDEIEESKILYIPSTGKGAVYICKNATSLDEVSFENADVVISVGETKEGMTVATTLYNDTEYYVVFNVTGTGGGEFTIAENIFDTSAPVNPYPSIFGTHNGTITPNQTITVHKLYTYPCEGTGGHTEHVMIYGNEVNESASWNGYSGDWHTIYFDNSFVLEERKTYNYTIITGSYPQIIHETPFNATGGTITCDKFIDANGRIYYDWIPAIKFF
jgi:parallel beta-helix repeat protein